MLHEALMLERKKRKKGPTAALKEDDQCAEVVHSYRFQHEKHLS